LDEKDKDLSPVAIIRSSRSTPECRLLEENRTLTDSRSQSEPTPNESAPSPEAAFDEIAAQSAPEPPAAPADLIAGAALESDENEVPSPADILAEAALGPATDFVEADSLAEEEPAHTPEAAGDAKEIPQLSAPPPAAPVHELIRKEQGPDTSPVSVLVSQVYEGPFDLLLDLIRKQDIDIYDIPIAQITAQFLAYVNRLKTSDMDVAGEFIYTASLLIHIKSKMLLPRAPSGPDDMQEDPRRELVERLLEHERFKNAAQMLQQKQMLEAATWTNPGLRDFKHDENTEPEIAADTTDLVRIFREILDRARNRPIINIEEDTVTVGQMIQFLTRRLTMEDKPVALRRLLANTSSERALIAMFLALLELVRMQAILLRQDRHFSEIFIKKNAGFEAVVDQGTARDDWQ
jgi:segregation and condensation protein A